jgi:hypothetical protein
LSILRAVREMAAGYRSVSAYRREVIAAQASQRKRVRT